MKFIRHIFRSVVRLVKLRRERQTSGRSSAPREEPKPAGSRMSYWQTHSRLYWFDE